MLLDHEPGMEIVGIAVQKEGLVDQVKAVRPDVVLIDWKLAAPAPTELFSDICSGRSPPKIIVLDVRPETKIEAVSAGADVFISKDSPPDQLLLILRKIKHNKVEENL